MEANKIIITGGATRIGAAIAKKLSGPNKEILIHYNKSIIKAKSLKKQLERNHTKVYLVKGDLSKEKDLNKICPTVMSRLITIFGKRKCENYVYTSVRIYPVALPQTQVRFVLVNIFSLYKLFVTISFDPTSAMGAEKQPDRACNCRSTLH